MSAGARQEPLIRFSPASAADEPYTEVMRLARRLGEELCKLDPHATAIVSSFRPRLCDNVRVYLPASGKVLADKAAGPRQPALKPSANLQKVAAR